MTLEREDDHVEQAKQNTISQYHELPRIQATLRSYAEQVQLTENMQWDVLLSYLLDSVTGDRLDTIGKVVGQERKGVGDAQYRIYIKARIRVNRSNGLPRDIVGLMVLLFEGTEHSYNPRWPAAFFIEVLGLDIATVDPEIVAELSGEAALGGVGVSVHYSEHEEDGVFTYASGDVEEIDPLRGYSDETGTTGGRLLGAY